MLLLQTFYTLNHLEFSSVFHYPNSPWKYQTLLINTLVDNIPPCNRNLHKWGKRDRNLCLFCQEEESISHLLYYCTRAKSIWDLIQNVILVDDNITNDMVIFG